MTDAVEAEIYSKAQAYVDGVRSGTGVVSVERSQGLGEAWGQVTDMTVITVDEGGIGRPEEIIIERRGSTDRRPALDVTSKAATIDWFRENLGGEKMPGFFTRDGVLVRVPRTGTEIEGGQELSDLELEERTELEDKEGPAQVKSVRVGALIAVIQTNLWPFIEKRDVEITKGSLVPERITRFRTHEVVSSAICPPIIEGSPEWPAVPKITAVTHTPMLRADGSLITRPGYDVASGVLYLPARDLTLLEMPEIGTIPDAWVGWARDQLTYLLKDFPFESDGHRANMYALLLTPLMRRVVGPPYPMFLINAHQRGTGKSLLAKVCGILHGIVHRPDLSPDDEEIRKVITSVLSTTTAPIVNFDNITAPIRSGQLSNLLTSRIWTDRILGRSESIEATNDRIWIATGNNIAIGGDLSRRVLWVSLDAAVARPELRTDFAEMDLIAYVEKKRGELLTALLVVLGLWVQNGMKRAPSVRTDDYGDWTAAMTEILRGSGLSSGFGDAAAAGDPVVSDDEMELEMLLTELEIVFGGSEFRVNDIKRVVESQRMAGFGSSVLDDSLPGSVKGALKDPWKSLGTYLTRHQLQFAHDVRIVIARRARGGVVYRLEKSSSVV